MSPQEAMQRLVYMMMADKKITKITISADFQQRVLYRGNLEVEMANGSKSTFMDVHCPTIVARNFQQMSSDHVELERVII